LVLELTPRDVFTLVSSMITAVALGITAGLGFKFARYRAPAQRAFSWTMGLGAYYVFCIGFSHGGGARHFPVFYASTQLLSGYIGPLLYFFCLSVADPLRKPNRWWLLAGVPGTVYSLYMFTHPEAVEFLAAYATDRQFNWHPVIVPLTLIHTLDLVGFAIWSYVIVLAQWIRARPGTHRRALGWLVAALTSVVVTLIAVNVLPFFGLIELIPFSSLFLIPVAAMAYRALLVESTTVVADDSDAGDRLLSRMESMGRVARALVHDINNMLTAVVCHAELGLLKRNDADAAGEHFREIQTIGIRAGAMHDRLISFAGRGRKRTGVAHPSKVIGESLSVIRPQLHDASALVTKIDPDLPLVSVDPDDLHRAITNLLLNAIEAIESEGGRITLTARADRTAVIPRDAIGASLDGSPAVLLEIADNGCGMDEQTAGQIFEPFFSTKGQDRGLGLVSVMAAARDAGAAMAFTSAPGQGSVFRVWFAIHAPSWMPPVDEAHAFDVQTALIVDDDDQVRETLRELLTLCGIHVSCAIDGVDGLERIRSQSSPFDLALIDVRMPQMDGIELIQELTFSERPHRIILVSGDEPGARVDTLEHSGIEFLRKPISMARLSQILERPTPPKRA